MKKHITTAALVAATALAVTACTQAQANEPTQTDPGYTAGQYEVGTDVPAGEYVFYAVPDELGVITVKDGISADAEELNFSTFHNNNFFTLKEGTYLNVDDAKFYPVTPDTKVPVADGEAEYRVGIDIPAGEHTFVSTADEDSIMCASVTVRSDSTHDMGTIITSDFFIGEYRILLEDGQYVELSQCTLLEEGE